MVSAINTAVSGLAAAGKRLEVSANNIANQFSTKSQINGVTVDQPYVAQQVDQVSLTNGGVEAITHDVNPASVTIVDPNGQGATEQVPNVNTDQELVNQNIAAYDYKANLKTIKVQDNLDKSLLDIIG